MSTALRGLWRTGIVALVSGAALLAAAHTMADPDLWGHVRFGQLLLEEGGIPRSDPYSYLTIGHPWINHEWLAEVLFAAVHGWAGSVGLVALKALASLFIVLAAYLHLRRRGLDTLRAGLAVMLLVALVRIGIATVRPHLFTYVLFFAVLLILEAAERGRHRTLWALPFLFALWANLHGGFLAGLGILAVWTAAVGLAELVARRRGATERPSGGGGLALWAGGALVASMAATLLNPYGPELLDFLARTATVPRPEITEWEPLGIRSASGVWYLLFLALLAAALLRSERPKRAGALAVLAVAALVPLLAVRHLPLFALSGIVLGGEHLAGAFGRRLPRSSPDGGSWVLGTAVAGAVLLAGAGLAAAAVPRFGCIELEEGYYPVRAVELLRESGTEGNLAVFFDWGEYAIWHLAPGFRVSMDGRRETVYPDSIYREHLRFVSGRDDWDALLDRRPTDAALVPASGPSANLLRLKPGWAEVAEDTVAALFAREEWDGLASLRAAASMEADASGDVDAEALEGERMCFP